MNQLMNIPEELKQLPQWVCRKEKIPFNPITDLPAKAGQPATWASFEDAVNVFHSEGYDGIGFEFNNNGIVGIDLDIVDGLDIDWNQFNNTVITEKTTEFTKKVLDRYHSLTIIKKKCFLMT